MFNTKSVTLTEESEIRFLKRARHEKIVWCMGCGYVNDAAKNDIFVVLEYMNFGDFRSMLWKSKRKASAPPPPWETRVSLLKDTADGMAYLHGCLDKIHRDLKSPNVLIHKTTKGRLIAKVGDFGLAKAIRKHKVQSALVVAARAVVAASSSSRDCKEEEEEEEEAAEEEEGKEDHTRERERKNGTNDGESKHAFNKKVSMTSFRGSLLWMAPEVFPKRGEKRLKYDKKVDVYSFGIILWETIALRAPWSGERFKKGPVRAKIMTAVENGERPPIPVANEEDAPRGLVSLTKRCWDCSSESRPRFIEALHILQNIQYDLTIEKRRKNAVALHVDDCDLQGGDSKRGADTTKAGAAAQFGSNGNPKVIELKCI
eukprot:g4373.t1